VKLAIAVETASQWQALSGVDFAGRDVDVVPFVLGDDEVPGLRVPCSDVGGLRVPAFEALVASLDAEQPTACLVPGDGAGSQVFALAADLLAIPLFRLVRTAEQLANLAERSKPRPDLFFLTAAELLPQAVADRRYGSRLLPTGEPGRDPAAGGRILDAVERWRRSALDSERPQLSVIVPAYREAANLPLVCGRLLDALDTSGISYEVLLVDDASPDETYRVALEQMWRSPRIRALTKPLPRGMGNAIRHGITRARADVLAITMGDGSDEVERIPAMYARVREGYGLAIGSRYRHRVNYATVPRLYRFWSACFRLCTRLVVGLRLSDYTNAFRAFDRRIFERYGPESGGFEISPEITFKAWFATRRVAEVDVRHLKRAAGQSSFSFLRAGPGYGKILIKAFVNRLTGRWFTLDW